MSAYPEPSEAELQQGFAYEREVGAKRPAECFADGLAFGNTAARAELEALRARLDAANLRLSELGEFAYPWSDPFYAHIPRSTSEF